MSCGKAAIASAIASARSTGRLRDLGDQPEALGLLDVDHPAGDHEVERAPAADDARQPLGAAVDQRHAEAPLGEAEPGARRGDPQVAPQRELEAAGQAPAGDGGDRRLGRGEAGEAERAAGGVSFERLERLEVGAGAECLVARAGDDQRAGAVVVREGAEPVVERLRGGAVDGVAPLRPVDGEDGGGAGALVPDRVATSRHARRRGRCAPWPPSCGGPCACRAPT